MRWMWWVAVSATVVGSSCGSGCGSSKTCVAGSTAECACPGGAKGVQQCLMGGGFGTCTCPAASTPPTAPVVTLTPAAPTDAQDLLCAVTTPATDAEGDALTYQFTWTKNGAPFTGATAAGALASTVPASATSAGDTFSCAATANDGTASGPASAAVSVTVVASNRAPTAPVVTLTPAAPKDAQDLLCTVTTPATDADGDTLTYQFTWTKNGMPFTGAAASGPLASTVPAFATSVGDTFTCAATANDGKVAGASSAAVSVTVLADNLAPMAPAVTLTPAAPTDVEDLLCTVSTPAVDPEGDSLTYQFIWTRNGMPFMGAVPAGALASTVPASATANGDVFTCAATANDGALTGPASAAVSVVVQLADRSWSRTPPPAEAPPDSAYVITADTVTDTVTGLVWQRAPFSTALSWPDAEAACANLTLAGATDWRLPSTIELLSIVDSSRTAPSINPTAFPNTPTTPFWASTRVAFTVGTAWIVHFGFGTSSGFDETLINSVRCVR